MAGMMQMMMRMNKENMKSMMEPMVEVLKSQMRGRRKREEEEEEGPKSRPIVIDIQNHHLKDDVHTELDMVARSVRPYNGGDQAAYWAKRRQKAEPVIEDLKMAHLTKTPVNPSTIAQLHDRGFATSAKQWLSSNFSVRDNDRKIRAAEKGTAGAYYYDYAEAASVWDAVDAIHNYTMVLRMVHEATTFLFLSKKPNILCIRKLRKKYFFSSILFVSGTSRHVFFLYLTHATSNCFVYFLL